MSFGSFGSFRSFGAFALAIFFAAALSGCSSREPATPAAKNEPAAKPVWPEPADEALLAGKAIWDNNCQLCHKDGLGGAPVVMRFDLWESRIAQDRATLYTHAIEGFFGSTGEEMPPRGGNDDLTDDQVKSAVDYQVWIVEQLNQPH